MRLVFYLQDTLANLLALKLRATLTILSIAIGSASVIAMVTGGKLATQQALEQFKALGTDLLSIHIYTDYENKNQNSNHFNSTPNELNLSSVFPLNHISSNILQVAPYTNIYARVDFQNQSLERSTLLGCTDTLASVLNLTLYQGRFISYVDHYSKFCVLGHGLYEQIKKRVSNPLGQSLRINKHLFTIVGVINSHQSTFIDTDLDHSVFIPFEAASLIESNATITNIIVKLKNQSNYETTLQQIRTYFRKIAPNKKLYIQSAKEYIARMEKQQEILTVLLGVIGSISLIVGGIGIMNILLVSISERRYEIGIRLAMGARRRDIQGLFLVESALLALVGGSLGIILGTSVAWIIAYFQHWPWAFFLMPILIGFLASLFVGILFGYYPAYRAAQLNPIETLRTE